MNRNASSFQSRPLTNTSDMIPIGNYYGMNGGNGNLMFRDNSSINSSTSLKSTAPIGSSSGSLHLNWSTSLHYHIGVGCEWTEDEQFILEEGLLMYTDVPCIIKYNIIAHLLPNKSVRDIALRCLWMKTHPPKKRKKQEESHSRRKGRKGNRRKDKFVESSSKTNLPLASMSNVNVTPCPAPQPHQMDQSLRLNCQALTNTEQLLEQNEQALNPIYNNNLTLLKDNIDLFRRTRDNINHIPAIVNDGSMRDFPGNFGPMQEFPTSIDQNLVDSLLFRDSNPSWSQDVDK